MVRALTVVFDLDDTLCDYAGAREGALEAIGRSLGERGEGFRRAWTEIEPGLWRRYADGGLTLEAYRSERFAAPLREAGVPDAAAVDLGRALNPEYMRRCNEGVALFPATLGALGRLRDAGARLALLTDGPADGQRIKLRALGLDQAFDAVFISGETGYAKPDPRAFAQVEAVLPARRTLMVGDSLRRDVRPALARGWGAVWVAPPAVPDAHDAPPGTVRVACPGQAVDCILATV